MNDEAAEPLTDGPATFGDAPQTVDPRYRHALRLAKLSDCPPSECVPAQGVAYRFVLDPIDQRSFDPIKAERDPDRAACSAWGLSMYRKEHLARKSYIRLVATYGEPWREHNGTHLAVGTLVAAHGMTTKVKRQNSHFNLHEFANSSLAPAFQVLGPLAVTDEET